MLNSAVIIGRLTDDPKLSYTQSGKAVVDFTVAVNRKYNKDDTDFIDVVAWSKLAELCANYLYKGRLVVVAGRIQTGIYTDNKGIKRRTFEIVAKDVKFLDKNKRNDDVRQGREDRDYREQRRNTTDDWSDLGREIDISEIDIKDPWDE